MKIYEMDIANSAHLHCTSSGAMDKEVEEIKKRFR
jgi:hypothetical protein